MFIIDWLLRLVLNALMSVTNWVVWLVLNGTSKQKGQINQIQWRETASNEIQCIIPYDIQLWCMFIHFVIWQLHDELRKYIFHILKIDNLLWIKTICINFILSVAWSRSCLLQVSCINWLQPVYMRVRLVCLFVAYWHIRTIKATSHKNE